MSSMLKSLSIMMIAGSLAFAGGDGDVINYVKRKLSRNPQVAINDTRIEDKLPIPGIKGWSAYVVAVDINLTRGKKTRRVKFEDILFVSSDLITSELVDRKTGRDVRSMIQPKMPKDIYSQEHLLYGKPDAKHKIVLFSDPLCPFCRMSVPDLMKAAREHPDDIALYYYHLPLTTIHPASETLVRVMLLAQKEGKMDIVEKMYQISVDPDLKDEKKILEIVKKETGYSVTPEQLHQQWIDKRLGRDRLTSRKLLVTGTPTVFADGKKDVTREKYKSFIKKK
ncbi:thioredoxin domain-containing protein [Hydrogenimonas sp.]|uniref:thioredoxin domain-containing protein n=1 Tax=Hydrogenimonas sp. TaxID=2231112 RepID=UPI002612D986|nr:thioredoxin domain-containing protein [Hydrogenimonas sp.]